MSADPRPESRSRFRPSRAIATGVGVIWLSVLVWLVASSANPVTVNRAQVAIAAAQGAVVSGTVVDESAGRVQIVEVLSQGADAGEPVTQGAEISIGDLSRSGSCKNGQRYLFPLGRRGSAFAVMPTNLPGGTPLVYPDTEDARRQVADVLSGMQKEAAG